MAKSAGSATRRLLRWVGSANKVLCGMPEDVRMDFGRRINLAQRGEMPPDTKPLAGLGAGVLEMFEEFDGNAYRCVYLARYKDVVYVLHAFQKKSTTGIKTAKIDIEAIKTALRSAVDDYNANFKKG